MKRKERYRWVCTGCGHEVTIDPGTTDKELWTADRRLMDAAAEHLEDCPAAELEDVDGWYRAEACRNPYARSVIRRVRKIAFITIGKNKTLHIDYGAEHTPCGVRIEQVKATEVNAVDFHSGRLPKHRLCKTCIAYRRPPVAEEMALLESQYGRPAVPKG